MFSLLYFKLISFWINNRAEKCDSCRRKHATPQMIPYYFLFYVVFVFRFWSPLRILIAIKNLLSNLDMNLDWTGRASPQPGPGRSASLALLVMCDCFQRPQLVLETELGALNEPARERERVGGGCSLNGCGNWGAVECFMRLPQARLASCCVLYLFNLVFLIWIFTLLDSLRISASG